MNKIDFLVDSHCHLNYPELSADLDGLVKKSNEFGVKYLQTISTKLSEFDDLLEIVKKYSNIYTSIGVHPHEVDKDGVHSVEKLIELSQHPKVISFGETGLDYYYEYSSRENQQKSFINHITAARSENKPVVIHTRDAEADTISILESEMQKGEFSGLIHCFSGTENLAQAVLDMGLYISISGIITFKKADELRAIVKEVPLEKLLVETDAPYLAPIPMRGGANHPAYTFYVAQEIAKIKDIDISEVMHITSRNFFTLFNSISLKG